jgi:hypothetical protein
LPFAKIPNRAACGLSVPLACNPARKAPSAARARASSDILLGEDRVVDYQQVLRVMLLRRSGEVEGAREDHAVIDDHDLVMRNGVLGVNERRDAAVLDEIRLRVFLRPLAMVQDHLHLEAAPMRVHQGFGNRRGSKAVGLHQHAVGRVVQGVSHGVSRPAFRGEIDLNPLRDRSLWSASGQQQPRAERQSIDQFQLCHRP